MEEITGALFELKRSIDRQVELQEEANILMRGLISALQNSGQATADLVEALEQEEGDAEV